MFLRGRMACPTGSNVNKLAWWAERIEHFACIELNLALSFTPSLWTSLSELEIVNQPLKQKPKMRYFTNSPHYNWRGLQELKNKPFSCGYCGTFVSSVKGFKLGAQSDGSGEMFGGIYVCPNCGGPVFFAKEGDQLPSAPFGKGVVNVPEELNLLYEEARRCTTTNCFTSAVLIARKILMHIAVQQGAKHGLSFLEYVVYLSDAGYVPPNGKHWVDHIRKKGNEANHDIVIMAENDAKELIVFVEMLLRFIYEFPGMVPTPVVEK